jgi:hypothetical protein
MKKLLVLACAAVVAAAIYLPAQEHVVAPNENLVVDGIPPIPASLADTVARGTSTLLTDGKSRNSSGHWSTSGDQIAYTSTRRTGQNTDVWSMNPADPKTDHIVAQLTGSGWEVLDWSKDDKETPRG